MTNEPMYDMLLEGVVPEKTVSIKGFPVVPASDKAKVLDLEARAKPTASVEITSYRGMLSAVQDFLLGIGLGSAKTRAYKQLRKIALQRGDTAAVVQMIASGGNEVASCYWIKADLYRQK